MNFLRLCLVFAGATTAAAVLPNCAPIHDATPPDCPADQQPSGGLCVCVSTESPPAHGTCPPDSETTCRLDDCIDDGNPCTEPTCLSGADTCSHEPVANLTACQARGAIGMCLVGECVVGSEPWELGVPFRIGGGSAKVSGPLVSIAADGAAVVVWAEGDTLMASHLDPTEGWTAPQSIDDDVFPDRGFALDMDAAGNAVVAFARVEGVSIDVRAVRFDDASGSWGASETVSRAGSNASHPSISIAPDGEVVAAWAEAPNDIVLRRTHTSALAWDPPVVASPGDGYAKADPIVSIAGDGLGAVIYSGDGTEGTTDAVWVTPVGPVGVLGTPTRIDASSGEVDSVRIAAAAGGTLMALWERDHNIWHAYFDDEWSPAGLVEVSSADASGQEVAWDGDGIFTAAWTQDDNIRARQYSEEGGVWDDTEILSVSNNEPCGPPAVRFGSSGEGWLVWHEGAFIWMSHFAPDSGWGLGEKLSAELTSDPLDSEGPELALSADGTLVAVWADVTDVWAWVDAP